jgi:hypothetical protein
MAVRRRRPRYGARADDRRETIRGVVLGTVSLAVLGGFFWVSAMLRPPEIDAATGCPTEGPIAVHAIIIDHSDAISEQQAQQVRMFLRRILSNARAAERFDLYVAEGDAASSAHPIVRRCSPGRGADANALYQNPGQIQVAFEQQFRRPLDEAVEKTLEASARPTSPILETIRAVAITSFGDVERHVPRSLTIVSDMIQNSPLYSQFSSPLTSFEQLSKTATWRSLQANLGGAQVSILYLLRPSAVTSKGPIQTRGHQLFWEEAIRGSGGELVAMETY